MGWLELAKLDRGVPPLFFWSLKAALPIAGSGDEALRLISALFAAAAVAAVAAIGKRWWSEDDGERAAWLLGLSPFFLYFARTLKPYTLNAFADAASLWAALEALEADTSRAWARWAAVSLGALYAHALSGLLLAGEAAMALAFWRGRLSRRAWAAAAAVVAGFLPWLPLAAPHFAQLKAEYDTRSYLILVGSLYAGASAFVRDRLGVLETAGLAGLAAVYAAVWRKGWPGGRIAKGAALALAVGAALEAAFSLFVPGIQKFPGYQLGLLPIFCLLTAVAAGRLSPANRAAFLGLYLGLAGIGLYRDTLAPGSALRDAAAFVASGPPGPVACLPDWMCEGVEYYLRRDGAAENRPTARGASPRWIVLWTEHGVRPEEKAGLIELKKKWSLTLEASVKFGKEFAVLRTLGASASSPGRTGSEGE